MNHTIARPNGPQNIYKLYGYLAVGSLLLGVLLGGYSLAGGYLQQRQDCLSLPSQYDYLNTRYHFGQCQFQENDGWMTFGLN